MAQPNPEAKDPYDDAVGKADKTVTLIDAISNKVLGPLMQQVTSYREKQSALESLKDGLGEWADDPGAKDARGRWQQPVLGREAFGKHFMATYGSLVPSGKHTASFAWAHFLFALNIRPSTGVLTWRPVAREEVNPGDALSLIIDGELLCDIVNLYRLYTAVTAPEDTYEFPFGTLAIRDPKKQVYTFTVRSMPALEAPKTPFQYAMRDEKGRREGHLAFQHGVLEGLYLNAFKNGASESSAYLQKADKTLAERAEALCRAMRTVREGNWKRPCLITKTWIDDASRTKRRITTDGGADEFLVHHILDSVTGRDEAVKALRGTLPLAIRDRWEERLRDCVRGLCMFQGDSFRFTWTDQDQDLYPSGDNPNFAAVLHHELDWVLGELTNRPAGTPEKTLADAVPVADLLEILLMPHEIVNMPVFVLQGHQREHLTAEIKG